MLSQWTQSSTVQVGGKVEVTIPGLEPGDVVEVSVRLQEKPSLSKERPLGLLKGKIHIKDDFDAPLEEFDEYIR